MRRDRNVEGNRKGEENNLKTSNVARGCKKSRRVTAVTIRSALVPVAAVLLPDLLLFDPRRPLNRLPGGNSFPPANLAIDRLHLVVDSLLAAAVAVLLASLAIGATYFLGYIRFDAPPSPHRPPSPAAYDAKDDNYGSYSGDSALPEAPYRERIRAGETHWVFPPYCAPGGLRSRLFPPSGDSRNFSLGGDGGKAGAEGRDGGAPSRSSLEGIVSATPSSGPCVDPLELLLQRGRFFLLPSTRRWLESLRRDWRTLGGSNWRQDGQARAANWEHNWERVPPLQRSPESVAGTPPEEDAEEEKRGCRRSKRTRESELLSIRRNLSLNAVGEGAMPLSPRHRHRASDPGMSSAPFAGTVPAGGRVDKAGCGPLPQAILVYHESAHSIVFRDHLRRQQSAIRKTSSVMAAGHPTSATPVAAPPPPTIQESYLAGKKSTRESSSTAASSSVGDATGGYDSASSAEGSARSVGSASSRGSTASGSAAIAVARKARRKAKKLLSSSPPSSPRQSLPVVVANFQPTVEPLEALELHSSSVFESLMESEEPTPTTMGLTPAEKEVVKLIVEERAVVKTVRNADWTAFFEKFKPSTGGDKGEGEQNIDRSRRHRHPGQVRSPSEGSENDDHHDSEQFQYNSFVSSTTLLPSRGKKMRCFGSAKEFATGAIFALPGAFPNDCDSECAAAKRARAWSWPSGYSAKTEFNIDDRGNLINGREEALVSLDELRAMNRSYLHDTDYVVGGRMVKGGLDIIPYNEVYVRVGGPGRISCGADVSTGKPCSDADGSGRSFDDGIGLPVALFVRSADYGHLVGLMRARARFSAVFGKGSARGLPLLIVAPELGARVFTEDLQHQVLKSMAWDLNPFQNPTLARQCEMDNTSEPHLKQKLEELIDLDDDNIREVLTPEECARIAGGFGATDGSVANLLYDAMKKDVSEVKKKTVSPTEVEAGGHNLQYLVNEGLAFALRSGDYHTSRQLLILYTLVASRRGQVDGSRQPCLEAADGGEYPSDSLRGSSGKKSWRSIDKEIEERKKGKANPLLRANSLATHDKHNAKSSELGHLQPPPPPPPPPLDTDRLRSATNSDGLLAVLGGAQVLKAMQDGSAKRKVKESIDAIEEWIESGQQSVAFRVASWRDQRAAQGDLKIAMESDSNFMAFISTKAIGNRKKFAKQLRDASLVTDFESLQFLQAIHSILSQMGSPCLRLELLQYILGLDNRYSVAHVIRSVELAATCLNISENDVFDESNSRAIEVVIAQNN